MSTALTPSSVEFIEKASGIKSRYVMDKDGVLDPERMCPRSRPRANDELSLMAEMAVDAAREACTAPGARRRRHRRGDLRRANMQRPYPAMAVEMQHALGIEGFGFDMNVACSSATFGIEQAANAVRRGSARCALVVNPEICSAHLNWKDRDCHFIFGDVCTAVIVERADRRATERWDILGTRLKTVFSNNIRNNFGFLNRASDEHRTERDKLFIQEGRKVFKEVVPMVAAHIERHLHAARLRRRRRCAGSGCTRPTST